MLRLFLPEVANQAKAAFNGDGNIAELGGNLGVGIAAIQT
jgi:hypothetical protein